MSSSDRFHPKPGNLIASRKDDLDVTLGIVVTVDAQEVWIRWFWHPLVRMSGLYFSFVLDHVELRYYNPAKSLDS
jgi:hypothetical protein